MSSNKKIYFNKGIGRKLQSKNKYSYYYISNNKSLTDSDLNRVTNLKVPKNWENVWISLDNKSHVQAIGYDNAGRTQYLYHKNWIEMTEKNKSRQSK